MSEVLNPSTQRPRLLRAATAAAVAEQAKKAGPDGDGENRSGDRRILHRQDEEEEADKDQTEGETHAQAGKTT